MGDAKEKRERDTLLYYIRGSLQGTEGKDVCCEREGKGRFGEEIEEKNRGFGGKLEGAKRELNRNRMESERESNGSQIRVRW